MLLFHGERPKAQFGFLLDSYTYQGKTYNWNQFNYLQRRIVSNKSVTEVLAINLAKWSQERQRAEEIIENETDPFIKEQMIDMYESQNFALDHAFFGKEVHIPY